MCSIWGLKYTFIVLKSSCIRHFTNGEAIIHTLRAYLAHLLRIIIRTITAFITMVSNLIASRVIPTSYNFTKVINEYLSNKGGHSMTKWVEQWSRPPHHALDFGKHCEVFTTSHSTAGTPSTERPTPQLVPWNCEIWKKLASNDSQETWKSMFLKWHKVLRCYLIVYYS